MYGYYILYSRIVVAYLKSYLLSCLGKKLKVFGWFTL